MFFIDVVALLKTHLEKHHIIGAMIVTSIICVFLDKKGNCAILMMYGAILITVYHLVFALVPDEYFNSTIVITGIALSLVPESM